MYKPSIFRVNNHWHWHCWCILPMYIMYLLFPVIDHEFHHNFVKVLDCIRSSCTLDPQGDTLVDPQTTWSITRETHECVSPLTVSTMKISQWARKNFCRYCKTFFLFLPSMKYLFLWNKIHCWHWYSWIHIVVGTCLWGIQHTVNNLWTTIRSLH